MNRTSKTPALICSGICAIRAIHLQGIRQHALHPMAAAVITVIRVFLRRHGFSPAYHCMGSHPFLF